MSLVSGRIAGRLSAIVLLGALTAGCFQPMYAERTVTGEPALREKLSAIDVTDITTAQPADARLGVELRNGLLFNFTGGGSPAPPTHKLVVRMSTTKTSAIVDPTTVPSRYRELRHRRQLRVAGDRDQQARDVRATPSPGCPMTFPDRSSVSPVSAACATPRAAQPNRSPRTSASGCPRSSSPAPKAGCPHRGRDQQSRSRILPREAEPRARDHPVVRRRRRPRA